MLETVDDMDQAPVFLDNDIHPAVPVPDCSWVVQYMISCGKDSSHKSPPC